MLCATGGTRLTKEETAEGLDASQGGCQAGGAGAGRCCGPYQVSGVHCMCTRALTSLELVKIGDSGTFGIPSTSKSEVKMAFSLS